MDWLMQAVNLFLHLDKHLENVISTYNSWTYLILLAIIFCETGLVITPFLPGDSLLFAAGTFAARGSLEPSILCTLLSIAAIAGDTVNYWIGNKIGPKIFHKENVRLLNKQHLMRAHAFYERYGGITIVAARFMPIIRTFAPFVAGIGSMSYIRFLVYNVTGGIGWILIFVLGGFFFGNIPFVKNHFSVVMVVIIILSVMPGVIEYIRHRGKGKKAVE